jgi:hypothetical protein
VSNEQPEQTAEGLIGWLRDDADFQDHQRENGIPMLPAAEDAPHLRAAADMLERLESKLDAAVAELALANNYVRNTVELESRLDRAVELLRAVQSAKQKPGIADGEDSGSFNTILHGNWFICAADFLGPVVETEKQPLRPESGVTGVNAAVVEKPFPFVAVDTGVPKGEVHFVQDGKLLGKITGLDE